METKPWNAANHLENDEAILAYLEAIFEDGNPALIAAGLNDVAQAKGIGASQLTGGTHLSSVISTLKALGFELTAKAA